MACTSSSANDQRRKRVIAILHQGIGTWKYISMHALKCSPDVSSPRIIGDISPNSAEQRTTVGTPKYTKIKNVADTSATHRRCSQHARINIGDVY